MSENAEATRPREIEIAWTTPLRDWETEALADRWLFTPAGRWVARSLFATRVRPNQVSFASLVCGALAGIFFATALPALIVPAGLLVALSVVLDAADGELARARKQTSEMGKFFDNVADSVKTGSIVLGLAVGMQVAGTWGPLDVSLGLPMPARIWGLGILTGASLIVQVMTRNAVVTRWRFHGKGQRDSSYARMDLVRAELAEMRARGSYWLERIVIGLLLRFAGQGSAPDPADPAAPDPVYAAALLPYVRAWTFLGGATQFCAIVLASIAGVPLYGILAVTVVGDAIYVPLWLATRRAHRRAFA